MHAPYSWKSPIGLPNCLRWWRYGITSSSIAWNRPTPRTARGHRPTAPDISLAGPFECGAPKPTLRPLGDFARPREPDMDRRAARAASSRSAKRFKPHHPVAPSRGPLGDARAAVRIEGGAQYRQAPPGQLRLRTTTTRTHASASGHNTVALAAARSGGASIAPPVPFQTAEHRAVPSIGVPWLIRSRSREPRAWEASTPAAPERRPRRCERMIGLFITAGIAPVAWLPASSPRAGSAEVRDEHSLVAGGSHPRFVRRFRVTDSRSGGAFALASARRTSSSCGQSLPCPRSEPSTCSDLL